MDSSFAQKYGDYEQGHWWFHGRARVLRSLLGEMRWTPGARVLEIGVGPGVGLRERYPADINLVGVEPDERNARLAAERSGVPVYVGSVENLPGDLDGVLFDAITMFDVLEHVEDDRGALVALSRRLAPGGKLVLTVPAYQWMWGEQDEVNRHFRRYTRGLLRSRVEAAGYRVLRSTYFNTLLFPPIAMFRVIKGWTERARPKRTQGGEARSDFEYSLGPVDAILRRVFGFESRLLRLVNFPFGVSVFVSAERRPEVEG